MKTANNSGATMDGLDHVKHVQAGSWLLKYSVTPMAEKSEQARSDAFGLRGDKRVC